MQCIFEPMTHVTDKLTEYLDSAGTSIERRRIERHLRICAECRQAYEELRTTLSQLSALPRSNAPDSLKSSLLSKFRDQK
jgi:predicted anti-sigma-YlaC factor YlaD